jgi:transposase-like protein
VETDQPDPEPEVQEFDRARMAIIEAENRKLRMENEFLKKASAFFARTQD